MTDILEFRGPTRWLSNFHECNVVHEGLPYGSTEAAYQAAKFLDWEARKPFMLMTPITAMKEGRILPPRPNWMDMRVSVMYAVNLDKYTRHPELAEKLMDTDGLLVEGNNWGDTFWGQCNGVGENMLGKVLMQVRSAIQSIRGS